MKAGVVVYKREDQNLVGQWSHELIKGDLALDVASNVPECNVEGDWPIKIFRPSGEFWWEGHLISARFNAALKLNWEGKFQSGDQAGKQGDFVGIGIVASPSLIVASFEPIVPDEKE